MSRLQWPAFYFNNGVMTLNEAFDFHKREKVPFSYSLFQPYSPDFFRFLAEARNEEFFSPDDVEVFEDTELGLLITLRAIGYHSTYLFFVKQSQSIKEKK